MPSTTVDITAIAEAGVVGAGGAGFPTHVKLAGKADTVLINAAECEPLLHKDKEVLRKPTSTRCSRAWPSAMRLVGAAQGCVGIKEKYSDVIDAAAAAAAARHGDRPAARRLSGRRRVHPGLRRAGPGDSAGRHSAAVGAVVMNVETAMNVARGRPAAGHREIPHHRRRGGRAGHAARADRRDAGPVRGRGRRADQSPTPTTWSAA